MDHHGQLISPLQSLILDLPPSCVEFCPAHPDYFVVGAYELQKDEDQTPDEDEKDGEEEEAVMATAPQAQSRNGSLVVFRVDGNNVQHIETVVQPSAILDLHFHPFSQDILAVVNSTGMLLFLRFAPGPAGCLTEISRSYPLGNEGSIIFTACCWHPSLYDIIAITTSTHEVHVLALTEDWKVKANSGSLVHTHDDNAWTAAFPEKAETSSSEKVFTVLSGGDDSKLLQSTCKYITENASSPDDAQDGQLGCIENDDPPSNIRGHHAGVTAILPLEIGSEGGESILVTGSYDDYARVYVLRDGMPQLLTKANLGGGVWRLKLIRHEVDGDGGFTTVILASCMHAGARILRIHGNPYQSQIQVQARFEEHKSMNYGSDFQPGSGVARKPLRAISTSFYDKLLCLWDVPYDGEHLA